MPSLKESVTLQSALEVSFVTEFSPVPFPITSETFVASAAAILPLKIPDSELVGISIETTAKAAINTVKLFLFI